MPGGTTAYILHHVLVMQGGFYYLDSPPRTRSAQPHRPAFGPDGEYFSNPIAEDIFGKVYGMMRE